MSNINFLDLDIYKVRFLLLNLNTFFENCKLYEEINY